MGKTTMVRAILLVALALGVATPSAAEDGGTQSSRYIATIDQGPITFAEGGPAGVGGQLFRTRSPVLSVLVEDTNGAGVPVTVSQGDIAVRFCSGEVPFDLSGHGFQAGYFFVGIKASNDSCPTVGTAGTITIAW